VRGPLTVFPDSRARFWGDGIDWQELEQFRLATYIYNVRVETSSSFYPLCVQPGGDEPHGMVSRPCVSDVMNKKTAKFTIDKLIARVL
jgi:hypothetical protein